jgi:predicted CopG family antitoxin
MPTLTTRTIRISKETYADLAKHGTLSDTFDTVIQKLLLKSATSKGDVAEK